jgi:hypothetical protein
MLRQKRQMLEIQFDDSDSEATWHVNVNPGFIGWRKSLKTILHDDLVDMDTLDASHPR